jgi:hypothetical protein
LFEINTSNSFLFIFLLLAAGESVIDARYFVRGLRDSCNMLLSLAGQVSTSVFATDILSLQSCVVLSFQSVLCRFDIPD